MKRVASLLCTGVTTWSPIRFSNVQKGQKVAVAGYGGLGHMAVQYLVDLGGGCYGLRHHGGEMRRCVKNGGQVVM